MQIAIDASPISFKTGRGFRRYVLTLLQALALSSGNHRFKILTNEPNFSQLIPEDLRFECEPVRRRLPFCYRPGTGLLGKLFLRGIDLVHFPCANVWASNRGKAVVTLHDVTPLQFPEKFFTSSSELRNYQSTLKRIAQKASRIITVSRYSQKEIMRHLNVPEEKVPVIYNFPDARFSDSRLHLLPQRLKNELDLPYFLFVGGLDFRKNISLLLDAFQLYSREGGTARLILAGQQNTNQPLLYPPLLPLLKSHPFKDKIIWLKDTTDEELPALYHHAIALVFPSLAEGFGYPLVEAMASRTPIITVDTTCLKEISGDAALIAELSASGLAGAMHSLENNYTLRQDLIERGTQRVKIFNVRNFAVQLLNVYDDVMCD